MLITAYLHSSKETMSNKGFEAGLPVEVLGRFAYALYEVKLLLDVNEQDGMAEILKVEDRHLISKIKKSDVKLEPKLFRAEIAKIIEEYLTEADISDIQTDPDYHSRILASILDPYLKQP
jgi:hypothetical protein